MTDETNQVWVPIDRPVDDPRAYHRSDDRFVRSVFAKGGTVLGFYGLRRFGKTSFLRKIERTCKASTDFAASFDAEFVEMQNKPEDLNARLVQLKESLKRKASEENRGTIILLDDLEQLDLFCPKEVDRDASIAIGRVTDTLKEIFETAQASEGRIRIVLCEPTNFQEWLHGNISQVGPKLLELIPASVADMFSTLPILQDHEAAYILSGWPSDGPPGEFDESFVGTVNLALGGNPWFLAIAADLMRRNPSIVIELQDRVGDLVSAVDKAAQEKNAAGMKSIYEALSTPEKLVVSILYERKEGTRSAREKVKALFARHHGDPWSKSGGASVAKHVHDLGLASDSGEKRVATELSSAIFSEVVSRSHRTSVVQSPTSEEVELWNRLCKSQHPSMDPTKPAIIHQFGDLFFDDKGHSKSWTSYLAWLVDRDKKRKQSEDEDRDEDEKNDERPHLIVICGNLVAGYPTAGNRAQIYDEAISRALQALGEAVPHLQSAGDVPPASQIIIVPGVLDLNWTKRENREALRKSYRQVWDQKVQELGFSRPGEVHRFSQINVDLLPFDTVSLEGTEPIDDDIAHIRERVNQSFREEWGGLISGQKLSPNLVKYTLEYTIRLQPEERAPQEITETFVWRDQDPNNGNRRLLSEAGSVPASRVSDMIGKLQNELQKRTGAVSIAITHHYPRQRRRSSVTEFLNPFRFRQALVNAGIPMILHGHSPAQQCLFEGTPRATGPAASSSSRHSADPEGGWARAMYLVGAGSFSAQGNMVLDDEQRGEPRRENPTFNEIRIIRRQAQPDQAPHGGGQPDDIYDIHIGFFELADGKIRKHNEFNFPVTGNHLCTQQNPIDVSPRSGRVSAIEG